MNEMFEILVIKELSLQKKKVSLSDTAQRARQIALNFCHLRLLISECNCKNESFAPTPSFVNHTVQNKTNKHHQQAQLSLTIVTTFIQQMNRFIPFHGM